MPTQMPSSGTDRSIASRIAARHESSSAAVTPKWPTPGTITPVAPSISDAWVGVQNRAPTAPSALRTEVRLPAP